MNDVLSLKCNITTSHKLLIHTLTKVIFSTFLLVLQLLLQQTVYSFLYYGSSSDKTWSIALKIIKKLIQQNCNMLFKQGLIFFLIIQFSTCDGFPTVKISENICRTLECNQTASRVLNYMDATINPCDNFYKFACGNFIKNTNIYDDKNEVSAITVLKDKVLEQLTTIVQKLPSNLPKRLQLVKTFYDICMNESAIEENGLNPLKDKFNKLGGWPVLEGSEWKEDDFSWTKATYTLRELGYSFDYLFSIDITVDLKNNSIPVIEVDKPRLELDPQLLINGLENKIVKGYKKYMVDVAVLLGAERDYAEKELTKSFLFERALGNFFFVTITHERIN
ncbi:neprilysin-2-like isoform X2 [Cotesia typhae]|uniref:neprilysin-2-like isoform X2 n=1 Tax=Cotesia typhae TaxID=2053667 RepID=UPI003D699891